MTKEEAIAQLESMVISTAAFADEDKPLEVWWDDLQALRYAISVLKKEPAAPQQNRPLEKITIDELYQEREDL